MPTAKPRVAVTMKPEHYEVLSRLSAARGVSMSSILSELWEVSVPVMARVANLLEQAKGAQESAKEGIREATDAALQVLVPQAQQVITNFDLFEETVLRQIEEEAEHAAGGRRQRREPRAANAGGVPQPPSSNTGVRFLETNKIKGIARSKK